MKPIGYWLKRIDGLLENNFAELLASEDLTRRHWQILNVVSTGPHTMAEIDAATEPFLNAETPTFRPIADELRDRGWLAGEYELTDLGRAAHREISAKVHAHRAKVVDGISDEEHVTLVKLLEKVATNAALAR